jgi:sortase A
LDLPNPYYIDPKYGRYGRPRNPFLSALRFVAEAICWLVAIAGLGWFAFVQSNAYFYQADQNRRLDAQLRRPAQEQVSSSAAGRPVPAATTVANKEILPITAARDYYAAPGDLIGRIEIPKLKISAVIVEGVDEGTLRNAVGHIPGTALPGQPGNIALAGHRDSFFRKIGNLHDGDQIVLETTQGTFSYHVTHIGIVMPSDTTVLDPTDHPVLTLVTCFPFRYIGPAPDRYIVTAH